MHNTALDGAVDEPFDQTIDGRQFEMAQARAKTFTGITPLAIDEKTWRAGELAFCVELGMTIEQIALYSQTWPHPLNSRQHVHKELTDLGLRSVVANKFKRPQSLHKKHSVEAFLKIHRSAWGNGLELTDVDKEQRLGFGSGVQYDMKFRIDRRLYFLEMQLSRLTGTGWRKKLKGYLTYYYDGTERPFRVLIVLDRRQDIAIARSYARDILRAGNPKLTLYYFAWLNDVIDRPDCVCGRDVWITHNGRRVALLD